ncbi:Hpt domain-containing protein [Photobacterium leiognathi]|uniref:Hpt domain-containing protein n=1 Tax=Photobacterium leiognathi TaxID=553611 RepID=UPI003F750F6B
MSFDLDEDILQDFLIEAGEILELLSEQLVELERSPDDSELLNAIFRGFHTVKGGAGFLSLTELVDACHGAENVFDLLRTGKRSVTSDLMDVILEALDCINVMFEQVKAHEPIDRAEQRLLDALHFYSQPPTADESVAPIASEPTLPEEVQEQPVIINVEPEPVVSATEDSVTAGDSVDDMTQDEFDRLLDELHGSGQGPSSGASSESTAQANVTAQIEFDSGDITDDEFERLLDELHGSGKGPGNSQYASTSLIRST